MKRFLSALLSFIIVIGTFFAVPYKESPFVIFASAANDGMLYEYNSATDSYIVAGLEDKAVTEIIIAESINTTRYAVEVFIENAADILKNDYSLLTEINQCYYSFNNGTRA